jgi:hypothetical protein
MLLQDILNGPVLRVNLLDLNLRLARKVLLVRGTNLIEMLELHLLLNVILVHDEWEILFLLQLAPQIVRRLAVTHQVLPLVIRPLETLIMSRQGGLSSLLLVVNRVSLRLPSFFYLVDDVEHLKVLIELVDRHRGSMSSQSLGGVTSLRQI